MAISNHERVGKAMDLLRHGLAPFIEREFKNVYKDQARAQAGRFMGEDRLLSDKPLANLKPWREVITPHKDVASGRYQQAEFAADLWQVHVGEGTDEYKNPAEFFRRTYLTESLKRLLVGAVQRLELPTASSMPGSPKLTSGFWCPRRATRRHRWSGRPSVCRARTRSPCAPARSSTPRCLRSALRAGPR